MEMTPRERVLTALDHREPDRVPMAFGGDASTIETDPYEELKTHLGIDSPTVCYSRDHVAPDERIMQRIGSDIRFVRPEPVVHQPDADNSYVDQWGTRWRKSTTSLYWEMAGFPLQEGTLAELRDHQWPCFEADQFATAGEEARRLRREGTFAVAADLVCYGVFEMAWSVRGIEHFLEDLAARPDYAGALLERIVEVQETLFEAWLSQVGDSIDVVMVSDDVGIQSGLMISPRTYRTMIKPFQRRLWSYIKERTGARLFLHTCGSVYPVIGDFVELGVDILNPIQPMAADMDTKRLKREFGDELVFWGGIDTQRVLPHGSQDDITEEVKRRLADLAPGGGYIFSPAHNVQLGVSPQNVVHLYDMGRELGRYPLSL